MTTTLALSQSEAAFRQLNDCCRRWSRLTGSVATGCDWRVFSEWPRLWGQNGQSAIGQTIFLADDRIFDARRFHAVVSSCTSRLHDSRPEWNRRLELALADCRRQAATLLYSPASPIGPHVEHVASRFGLPRIRLNVFPDLRSFLMAMIDQQAPFDCRKAGELSPVFAVHLQTDDWKTESIDGITIPLVDQLMVELPDQLSVLELRAGGRIEKALQKRISDDRYPPGSVRIPIDRPAPSASLAERSRQVETAKSWMSQGAVGWMIDAAGERTESSLSSWQLPQAEPTSMQPILPYRIWQASLDAGESVWLTHCTRARSGPWPDESQSEYFDQLMLGRLDDARHPIDTLCRILTMQRLVATRFLKQAGHRSVSFSEVPLFELLSRRKFQSHLSRWDWEPYGICLRKDVAERLGFQKVQYRDGPLSQGEETKLVQPKNRRRNVSAAYELEEPTWEKEREWRYFSDLRLSMLPPMSCIAFVPTIEEARWLACRSSLPLVIVGAD